MECEICKRNVPKDGVTLHRVNPTGVKGIWRCTEHLTAEQRQNIDPEVVNIVRIVEEDNRQKGHL